MSDFPKAGSASPAGAGMLWFSDTPPPGWAILDGSTLTNAATNYPALYANVDPAWKSGNDIILPDLRGRMPVGKGTQVDVNAFAKNEYVTLANRTPKHAHTHSLGLPNHIHGHSLSFSGSAGNTGTESADHAHGVPMAPAMYFGNGNPSGWAYDASYNSGWNYNAATAGRNAAHTHSFTPAGSIAGAIGNPTTNPMVTGSVGLRPGTDPNDSPAYLVVNFIIKLN